MGAVYSQQPSDGSGKQKVDTLWWASATRCVAAVHASVLAANDQNRPMVGNGRAAVEQVRKAGGAAYDIVLMDIQMPEMDGYEATRRMLQIVPDLPILGQTAHALMEERDKCLAAGMVDHIAKPIEPDALVAMILLHVRGKPKH